MDGPRDWCGASLVAQLVKNPPTIWETWAQSLGWEESPGEGKGYSLQYSGLENSMDYSPWGHKELNTTEQLSFSLFRDMGWERGKGGRSKREEMYV